MTRPPVVRIFYGESHQLVLLMVNTSDIDRLALYDHPEWPARYELHGGRIVEGLPALRAFYEAVDAQPPARPACPKRTRRRGTKYAAAVEHGAAAYWDMPEATRSVHEAALAAQQRHPELFPTEGGDPDRGGVFTAFERALRKRLREDAKGIVSLGRLT